MALELLALALSAGAGLAESVEIVAERSPPAVRGDLLTVVSAVRWGWTWAQAWDLVDPCWAGARRAVALAEAAGAAPGAPLARAAADLRAEHGIRLELAAARLGVRIVLPLGLAYLPAFVVLTPNWKSGAAAQALFTRMWSSGFLAGKYTGVVLRHVGDPVLYVQNPPGVGAAQRRAMLDTLDALNQQALGRYGDPETQTRIAQYEMAFRMQTSVPELTDTRGETQETLDLYGPDVTRPGTFAASALLARRLIERGVRVVQLLHRGWDQHGNLPRDLRAQCEDTDQPTAALLC